MDHEIRHAVCVTPVRNSPLSTPTMITSYYWRGFLPAP